MQSGAATVITDTEKARFDCACQLNAIGVAMQQAEQDPDCPTRAVPVAVLEAAAALRDHIGLMPVDG